MAASGAMASASAARLIRSIATLHLILAGEAAAHDDHRGPPGMWKGKISGSRGRTRRRLRLREGAADGTGHAPHRIAAPEGGNVQLRGDMVIAHGQMLGYYRARRAGHLAADISQRQAHHTELGRQR